MAAQPTVGGYPYTFPRNRSNPNEPHRTLPRQESVAVNSALSALQPLEIAVVAPGTAPAHRWASYLTHDHYLGLRVVGENLGYLARDRFGREAGGLALWRAGLALCGAGPASGLERGAARGGLGAVGQ